MCSQERWARIQNLTNKPTEYKITQMYSLK